ncbi:MAG TPA: hypothetical protein PK402_14135 [Tepidisphaeraceae bacterium]|nr:hypothetical protein [Tepidisphaeraceae bacterium]
MDLFDSLRMIDSGINVRNEGEKMLRFVTAKFITAGLAAFLCAISPARAFDHDESVDGDLSNDHLAPNIFAATPGSNRVSATTGGADIEYLTFDVASGFVLSQLVLDAYASEDEQAFISVMEGSVFAEPNDAPNVEALLGYALFGPVHPGIGGDMLPLIGSAPNVIGFTAPLPEGSYSFWIQQTGPVCTYTLDFRIAAVPEPAALGLLCVMFLGLRRVQFRGRV